MRFPATRFFYGGFLLCAAAAVAQAGPPASNTAARAQQVPLSGQQSSGSVSVEQSASSAGSSVNTINTSIQLSGRYQGSIPGAPAPGPALTLPEAIRRGLQYNLGAVSASASLRQARAQRLAALSQLLPNIGATLSMTAEKEDLQALGLSSSALGHLPFSFPVTVGPFHYYDARGTATENALDLTAIHNYQSAKDLERASEMSEQDAHELVVLAVSGEYLRTLAGEALVASQKSQVQYAQASYDQAAAQQRAGTKAPIDAQRSLIQLQTEQQRLRSDEGDLAKQKLVLARIIGLPLSTELTLQEKLAPNPEPLPPVEDEIERGLAQRADLKSAQAGLQAAEQSLKAARSERIPSLSASAYYGIEGVTPTQGGNGVFSATGSVNLPLWQGGRISSDIEQAQAAVDQRRAEYQNQRGAVELDIRDAYIDLTVSSEQVKVAESNRRLALDTLRQSQDRFAAGVADSVEVVQSEESLASAESDYVNSLYAQNVARIDLARAMGEAEQDVAGLLKGQ